MTDPDDKLRGPLGGVTTANATSRRKTIWLTHELCDAVRLEVYFSNLSESEIIRRALAEYLDRQARKRKEPAP